MIKVLKVIFFDGSGRGSYTPTNEDCIHTDAERAREFFKKELKSEKINMYYETIKFKR